jgi:FtsH-binding integral membrane protein
MENLLQIVSVPVISAVVYGAMELYKYTVNGKESLIRVIPVIAVVFGVVLGIVAFFATPDIIAADNVFTAILIGGASGLAATGTNQIFKQLGKGKEEGDENDNAGNG